MVSSTAKTVIVFSVGVAVVVLASCLGWILAPNIVESQVMLKEGNEVYTVWLDPIAAGVPVYMKFYVFNVTNAEQVFENNEKPNLVQLGPYTYSEGRSKDVLENGDGLVTFEEEIFYYFNDEMTTGSLDDVVYTINPIYFTLASFIAESDLSDSLKKTVSNLMHTAFQSINEGPYMKVTIDELLFKGWDILPYLELYNQLASIANNSALLPDIPMIPINPNQEYRFGYFSLKNGTSSGNFTIETGENGLRELGYVRKWNGLDRVDYWNSNNDPYCNMINGTDGTIYPPNIDPEEKVYIFNTDLCRSIYAVYEQEMEQEGLKVNRFIVPPAVFDSDLDENLCFCRTPYNRSECFLDSVLDMRPCVAGVPLLMSSPHFLYGDQRMIDALEGIEPDKETHQTHFDLEPASSAAVFASKRIQANLDVRAYYIDDLKGKINNTVFPMFWVDESAKLDAAGADDLKSLLGLVNGIDIGRWVFLGCGIALCLAAIVMAIVYATKRGRKSKEVF